MEYLNELDKDSLLGRLKNFFENVNEAEQYEATSIRDFLDNVDMIKPTRKKFFNARIQIQWLWVGMVNR